MTTNKGYLTIEEVISIPMLGSPSITNDGQQVAYVKNMVNWDDNQFQRHVWIYDQARGDSYPLTTGKLDSTAPIWSPDGTALAYLSPVGEGDKKKQQLFVKFANQFVGVQITHAEEGVEKYRWAPDGKGFYYLSLAPLSDGMKKRKELYGDFEYVDREYQRNCLFYIDLATGLQKTNQSYTQPKDLRDQSAKGEFAVQLTDGKEFHIYDFDISPNGQSIVFNAAPSPNQEDCDLLEMYILDVASCNLQMLNVPRQFAYDVYFSPDGKKICYTRYAHDLLWYNNIILEVFDLQTEKTIQPALPFDESIAILGWTERGIFIEWQERTNKYIGLITEAGDLTPLVKGNDCYVLAASVTKDGQHVAYVQISSKEYPELYLDGTRVTAQWKAYTDRLHSQKEIYRWKSLDGTEIEGILIKPADFDPTKKYPLLVHIHGGPTGTSLRVRTLDKYYPIEQFVAKGFIILEPNYRGSAGYGEEFRKLNVRDLGTGDYADVISGVDALIEQGIADKERVGVMGWSQGGYISAFCATYSDRFKAISVGAGISDWMTYYVNTDVHQFTRFYLQDTPWNDESIYKKTSPMTYIKSACTPTLIQHGDNDQRVPVPNAYELYQGLRDMGVETVLVIFKGMDHNSKKPGITRAIAKQNLSWFSHHLLGESLDGFDLT